MNKLILDDDVADVLARAEISGCELRLSGQVERGLYLRVAKVLKALGGKWNRKAQAHIFPRDPATAIAEGRQSGVIEDRKKTLQAFYTPPTLARHLVQLARVGEGHKALEPSAGHGSIAKAMRDVGARVYCVEIDGEAVSLLRADGLDVHQGDFLDYKVEETWDRIVMNPPFAKGQAVRHVTHALSILDARGVLVAVLPAGVRTNTQRCEWEFRQLVKAWRGRFITLPKDSFRASGTRVEAVALVVG